MFYEYFARERRGDPRFYLGGRDENLSPGVRYGPVIRDIFIVECCTSGYGSVIINGREFSIGPGDCYILFPGDTVTHTADFKEPRCGVWCGIDGLGLENQFRRAGLSAQSPFAPKAAFGEILAQVEGLLELQDCVDGGTQLRQIARIYDLVAALLRNAPPLYDGNPWVQRAVGILETRYHEPFSVESLAREVGLERSYFSTLFKEQVGLAPHEYLTALRLRKACVLLREGNDSVGRIAEYVGLDPRNFSRLLKKETGKTPREIRGERK